MKELVKFLEIPFKETKIRQTAKLNGFKWNPTLKLWEHKNGGIELDETYSIFEFRVKSKNEKKAFNYAKVYHERGFDYAEEGNDTGI